MIRHAANRVKQLFSSSSGYDAVKSTKKRRAPRANTRHEDEALRGADRKRSVSGLRELHRNFAIVAWVVRKHLDYVSRFDFQSRTNTELDDQIESLMSIWMRPSNCDITGRFPFKKMLRMAEGRRVVDNDLFLLMLRSGHLQAIEGDRIADPTKIETGEVWRNGIRVNRVGRPVEYALFDRDPNGGTSFSRKLSARNVLHHGFFERFDQYRGISPLNAAVNSFRDCYEGIDLALAKMKVEQMFALVFARQAEDSVGEVSTEGDEEGDGEPRGYSVDFGRGPIQLDLDPGDTADFLKSDNPGTNTREFLHVVLSIAIKALDLPFNFYDESHTNFFGSRAAWLLYDRSCQSKRDDVLELLRKITVWLLRRWIVEGLLVLPEGMRISDLKFEWVHEGMPWWDPAKEINGNIAAMSAGLDNPYRICKETGRGEFEENIDRIAEAQAYAESKGVRLEFLMQQVEPDDQRRSSENRD